MNHTPGPWHEAGTGNHQGLVISDATGANVAVTYDKKDAPIVAASPEMFEALTQIEAMALARKSCIRMPNGMMLDNFCHTILAKAEGKE
jgi:hypothetical protein